MDSLESKFINMSLTKKMYLYFNHYKNEEDISNYEKKSITITNSDFKNLKLINNEDKFKDFFEKYKINFILNINEKSRCIIINYLRDYKKNKNYNRIKSYNHFFKPIENRVHNRGDGKGKYIKFKCTKCNKKYNEYLKK
tara:strand:+ start:7495 stop:7911 length:417 start_codon:yes stop_codon:yes gene_type:complete